MALTLQLKLTFSSPFPRKKKKSATLMKRNGNGNVTETPHKRNNYCTLKKLILSYMIVKSATNTLASGISTTINMRSKKIVLFLCIFFGIFWSCMPFLG